MTPKLAYHRSSFMIKPLEPTKELITVFVLKTKQRFLRSVGRKVSRKMCRPFPSSKIRCEVVKCTIETANQQNTLIGVYHLRCPRWHLGLEVERI